MNVRYRVTLSAEERAQLQCLVSGGKGRVRRIKRAQILLAADARAADDVIAANVSVGTSTVYRTKRRFVEEGLEQALSEEPRPGADRKLSATQEALLVATACAQPPADLTPGIDKVRCDFCGRAVYVRPPPPAGFRDPWSGSKAPRISPHWSNPMRSPPGRVPARQRRGSCCGWIPRARASPS